MTIGDAASYWLARGNNSLLFEMGLVDKHYWVPLRNIVSLSGKSAPRLLSVRGKESSPKRLVRILVVCEYV